MDKEWKHIKNLLINVYELEENELKNKSKAEAQQILKEKEHEKIAISKNPNKFWYIKGMPAPKLVEPETSKKWGVIVVISLFLVLIGFLIIFMILAFIKN